MSALRLLVIEDLQTDAELAVRELTRAKFKVEWRRVETAEDLARECREFAPDIVLSDFSLPRYSGSLALRAVRELLPHVPFIFVSGTIGEETAIESLRGGATDYVLKTNLARLPAAVHRALQEAGERAALRHAEDRIAHSERVLRSFMENLPGLAYIKDADDTIAFVNRVAEWVIGRPAGELVGTRVPAPIPDSVLSALTADDALVLASGAAFHSTLRLPTPTGEREWFMVKFPLGQVDSAPHGIGAIAMDMTERLRTEEALRLRDQAVEASVNPIVIVSATDPDMPLVYANRAFERVTGYTCEEVLGRNMRMLQGNDSQQPELEKIRRALADERPGQALLRNYRKDGSVFWNQLYVTPVRDPRSGAVTHFVGVQHDITEVKHYQDELEHQATHDALTGLPNRILLKDRLAQAQALAHRAGSRFSVAFIDLDGFKFINESLGHDVGDGVLRAVAERLSRCVREGDTVSRVGGDEFVILAVHEEAAAPVHRLVHLVMTNLREPIMIDVREFKLTCAVGIATFPGDGADADTLLRNADAAMYQAKKIGRDTYKFYAPEMNAHLADRLALEADLWWALARDELLLHYQPKVELGTGRIVGFEALVRWSHPVRGMVHPAAFIPLSEESGLVTDIGRWVIATACAQNAAWRKAGLPEVPIAVNVSARQLQDDDLVDILRTVLEMNGLPPSSIEIEITESGAMRSPDSSARVLRALRAMGVRISIDDFGTGYSSLSYLKQLPVTGIKIDQSFVRDLGEREDDAAIVRSVIAVAQALSLAVTAEGVENAAQAAFLHAHGCLEAQGFHFARPVPAAAAGLLLAAGVLRPA